MYASPDDAPDRQTALSSFEDLRRLNPNRHWHLILVCHSTNFLPFPLGICSYLISLACLLITSSHCSLRYSFVNFGVSPRVKA